MNYINVSGISSARTNQDLHKGELLGKASRGEPKPKSSSKDGMKLSRYCSPKSPYYDIEFKEELYRTNNKWLPNYNKARWFWRYEL